MSGATSQVGITLDIGRGGIGFLAASPCEEGQMLDLELTAEGMMLRLAVELAYCHELPDARRMRYRCGARLRSISVQDSRVLKHLLARSTPAHDLPQAMSAASY